MLNNLADKQWNVVMNYIDQKQNILNLLLFQPINIPVFHVVALRLLQMMNGHSYKIEEVIKLVNEDTALAAEMLKQANTSYNSGKAPITTIKNAIVRLGSQQVVNLAFSASMANNKSSNPIINKYLKSLWHHSHTVAITSAWLTLQIGHNNIIEVNADEAYLAGLLHTIGKLYLLKSIDSLFESGKLQIEPYFIDDIIKEHNIQQGLRVMKHLNLPEIYSNSIARQFDVGWKCGTNDYLVAAVRLSCKIHKFLEQGMVLTQTSEAFDQVKDELSLLKLNDVAYVSDFVTMISD